MIDPSLSHLLFVLDSFTTPHAGAESQFVRLVKGLQERGHRITIGVLRPSPVIGETLPRATVELIDAPRIASPASWWRLYRFLCRQHRLGARVVHVMFNDASLMVPPLARLAGLKSIISRLDMGYWYTPGLLRALRVTGRFVDCALANSAAVAAITGREERIPEQRLAVIYNGYEPPAETVAQPRGDGVRLGIVANIRPIKRMQDAIRAVAQLASDFAGLHLVIVGGGDPAPLQQLASELGVGDRVTFAGSQKNPESWTASFDIALLCSESEGFSNAIIEYLQQGKPVVCTRTGGNPEAIEDGVNGYLYPVGDVEALVDRLRPLVADETLRQRLGDVAKQGVADRFTMARMIDQHQQLYARLLGVAL